VGIRTVVNKTLTGRLGFGFKVPGPGKPGLSHLDKYSQMLPGRDTKTYQKNLE
jgi:hypothetical protein